MESEAKYTLVGSVIIFMTIGIVIALLWLGKVNPDQITQFYTVFFKTQSLDGLQVDGNVTMKGIKVGKVEGFKISPENIEMVKVTLALNADTPVKTDTEAVIRRNLLTGLATIDLINSSKQSKLLTQIPTDELYPVIPEGKTKLDVFADSLPNLLSNVQELTQHANSFLSEENAVAFHSILANAAEMTESLKSSEQQLKRTLDHLASFGAELERVSKSLTKFTDKSDARFQQVSDELTSALATIRSLAGHLDKQSDEITKTVTSAFDVLRHSMGSMAQDISDATQRIATTLEHYEEPRTILFGKPSGSLGPGESHEVPRKR